MRMHEGADVQWRRRAMRLRSRDNVRDAGNVSCGERSESNESNRIGRVRGIDRRNDTCCLMVEK